MSRLCFASLVVVALGCQPGRIYSLQPPGAGGPVPLDSGPSTPGRDAGPPPLGPLDAGTRPDAAMRDECGDLRLGFPVYFGTLEPTYLPMAAGQKVAVGTFSGCSGLLITPTWVLTARHCGLSPGTRFCMGAEPSHPDVCIGARRVVDNPRGDMTLVELEQDARDRIPEVVPVPILTEDMDSSWIRRTAEAAGYGQNERGGSGTRHFTAEPIVAVSGDTLTIDGEGRRGVCFGDSGGPVMVIASDGSVRVAGALSNGDGSCVGRDNFTRVDVYRDWIEGYTGPTTVESGGCGVVEARGRCMSGTATWCEGGSELRSERCEAGRSCGWDGAAEGFRCVAGADACGGYDGFGACDGDVARWCAGGTLRSRDCRACGETCTETADVGGAYCTADPCAGLDYLGRCNGDVAEWCDDGEFKTRDCAAMGQRCRWIDETTGFFCG